MVTCSSQHLRLRFPLAPHKACQALGSPQQTHSTSWEVTQSWRRQPSHLSSELWPEAQRVSATGKPGNQKQNGTGQSAYLKGVNKGWNSGHNGSCNWVWLWGEEHPGSMAPRGCQCRGSLLLWGEKRLPPLGPRWALGGKKGVVTGPGGTAFRPCLQPSQSICGLLSISVRAGLNQSELVSAACWAPRLMRICDT